MAPRTRHWLQIASDSGLPGLGLILLACVVVTLATAQTIDKDEAVQIVAVTCIGGMVAAYRVWAVNRKQRGN